MKKYYVYLYMRADMYSPYYVGKGSGPRATQKGGRNCNPPPAHRIRKVFHTDSEEEALLVEATLIKFYGRKCEGGILLNKQEGGKQPPSHKGRKWPEERKQKLSETAKRNNQVRYMLGKGGAKPGNKNSWGHRREIVVFGVLYPSVSHAARALNTSRQNIQNWASNKHKKRA